ncbi:MAG: GNAT family N-acetyltransferase [Deltaproteobacteria bacterium]|nr:GNAT family N-acetyltransferase [Deltaproteobacteria bacterium]
MNNWRDTYKEKTVSLKKALSLIKSGQRIFIGTGCGEPQHLLRGFANIAHNYTDIEIVRTLSLETVPLTLLANKTQDAGLNIRSFYTGSAASTILAKNKRCITPLNLSSIPMLFKSKKMHINTAFIQVSPPDDSGHMSLGISVDITLIAALSADIVIAQVNPKMPKTLGETAIHINKINALVEYEEPLLNRGNPPKLKPASIIAEHVIRLIDDGATIQIGLGTIPEALFIALRDKNNLGLHTQYMTDEIMYLLAEGIITNKQKNLHPRETIATSAIGSKHLYDFLNNNPEIKFYPADYVCSPAIIAQNHKMTALNVATAMDLTGQVAADAFPYNNFSGVNAMADFLRGASMSKQGKPIIMLTSASKNETKSRIVPLIDKSVIIPKQDVHYVATEYGAVSLFGKSLKERAIAMISLAHPKFREELLYNAKKMGLLTEKYSASKFIYGTYPLRLEEIIKIENTELTIRPSKPVDERRIQEHFYSLNMEDVISRFFHKKNSFVSDEIKDISQIDYQNNLTILAVIGEFGFGKVEAIGEYFLEKDTGFAEIAFSVSKNFQKKGLGKILIKKLAYAAKMNNIEGFVAYTSPDNRGMIKLFNSVGYKTTKAIEDDMLILKCKFAE